jgi:hypothetical protein
MQYFVVIFHLYQTSSKKAKGFWPTPVEYEYQGLIREIAFQQSPNKDKDDQNPL